jgi:proteic killer suppression protein
MLMIKSFRHKGLKLFFEEDDGKRLPADMLLRIRIILSTLHATQDIEGMNSCQPFGCIPSKGIRKIFML